MTDKDIERIEEFYGGRSIGDLVEIYGMNLEELAKSVDREVARVARIADEEVMHSERQRIADADREEFRLTSEERFKTATRNDFLKSNPHATDSDFERLYPSIRDEYMLDNFKTRKSNEWETVRSRYEW